MKITVDRKYKKPTYTIGNLYINGEWFCNTIEDVDRGLTQSTGVSTIKNVKNQYPDMTAIPKGSYKITTNVVSPKYSKKAFYMQVCNGKVPRLLDVPGYDGILIHCGTDQTWSSGCIIIGENKVKGKLVNSEGTFKKFWDKIKNEKDISIDIV